MLQDGSDCESVDRPIFVRDQYRLDVVSPTERGRKAIKIGAFERNKGILIALSCRCGNVHTRLDSASMLQNAQIPICGLIAFG